MPSSVTIKSRAGIDAQLQHAEHGLRSRYGAFLPFRGNGRGADLLGGSRLILVGVIVKAGLGNDLDGGQRLAVENADLQLPAVDVLLDDDLRAEAQALGQRSGTSPRVCAIVTPMDEPLALGLTTQGSSVSSAMASISSAVYFSARHFAVVT